MRAALPIVLLVGCVAPEGEVRRPPGGQGDTDIATDTDTDTDADTGEPGPCPAHMALIDDFCVDRYEAHLDGWSPYEVPEEGEVAAVAPGQVPQGYISGEVASGACESAGKRLCTLEEWMRACEGPQGFTWPYGNSYDSEACNDHRASHPVVDYWGDDPDMWDSAHMNDPGINQQPDTVLPGGAKAGCVSADGVYDLHGNLHEWIAEPAGTFKGGFYADGSINGAGCGYTTTAHSFGYHDYSTGFRCCADPR